MFFIVMEVSEKGYPNSTHRLGTRQILEWGMRPCCWCAQVLSSDPPPLSWNVQNIFPLGVVIHERYDLKGSWVNRSSNVGSNAVV